MKISIFSEINQLKSLIIHRPGNEQYYVRPENLIEWIWNELHDSFSLAWNGSQKEGFAAKLVKLVLWENEFSRVEYEGKNINHNKFKEY